jgi:hypothetical protein
MTPIKMERIAAGAINHGLRYFGKQVFSIFESKRQNTWSDRTRDQQSK